MKKNIALALALSLLLIGATAWAAEPTVVTVEGKYTMGDLDSKKDARMLALMEAKRLALEKAGTYVESVSEVKNFNLTKDQINSLAAGVMSVDVLKEEWTMSGENMTAVILIRATIDTTNLKNRIASMHDEDKTVDDSDIREQLGALQKELAELKARQAAEAAGTSKSAPVPEMREKYDKIMNRMTALDQLEEGNRALAGGKWKQALASYDAALASNANLADAYAGQALVFQHTGRPAEAMKRIDLALKMEPNNAKNHATKAIILNLQGKHEPALLSLNRAIQLNPRQAKFYVLRANTLFSLKRREAALQNLQQACDMGHALACERIKQARLKAPREQIEGFGVKKQGRPAASGR